MEPHWALKLRVINAFGNILNHGPRLEGSVVKVAPIPLRRELGLASRYACCGILTTLHRCTDFGSNSAPPSTIFKFESPFYKLKKLTLYK